jgi:hypothetical protein
MNNEFGVIWKEAWKICFTLLSRNFPRETKRGSPLTDQDFNQNSPKCKSEALPVVQITPLKCMN